MNETLQQKIRYSPRPRENYFRKVGHAVLGPATSKLLDTVEAWNLAYLSFDYESALEHPDPLFTTYVRRTMQSRLDGTGAAPHENPTILVASLLRLPAPRFTYLVTRNNTLLRSLPLFKAYGTAWLSALAQRERLCEWGAPPEESLAPGSCQETQAAIFKMKQGRQ